MNQTLYLECTSGISGDMTVAALLDLGADQELLFHVLKSLKVPGFRAEVTRVKKAGLDACDFSVKLDAEHENHDHDMEYLHGHSHELPHDLPHHEPPHVHEHHHSEPPHVHEHHHSEMPHGHSHEHRGLPEIMEIIDHADMNAHAKSIARRIFTILAEAEAKAHGVPVEEVHFHEVGAVDSIVDIVAAAVCLDNLGITDVIIPKLCEGGGTIRCQHGVLPVPVPAVVNIVSAYGLRLQITDTKGELVTPTGAAIAAAVCTSDVLPEVFTIKKAGLGAGKRTYDRPSLLRAMLIETSEKKTDTIYRLETNIDDCTGENLGYVMDCLFRAGARDVHYMPVFMKKNRPAYQLNVICDEEQISALEKIIFLQTTTIGIRRIKMERTVLPREMRTLYTPLGTARVKVCTLPDGSLRSYPEYDSVAELADKNHMEFRKVYDYIKDFAEQ